MKSKELNFFLAKVLIFLVWSEMSLGMHLSAGR